MTAYSRATYQTVPTPDRTTFTTGNHDDSLPRQSAAIALSQPVSTPLNEEDLQLGTGSTLTLFGKAKAVVKRNAGLLLVAASQAFFSLMNVAVKKLNTIDPPVTALQLILVRMAITTICCVVYMYAAKVEDPLLGPKGVRTLLVVRGITGFISLFGIYYSLQYLSLSDATVLTFLTPMYTAVTGAVLLGEVITRRQIFAGIVSLMGVILIARPEALFGTSRPGTVPDVPLEAAGAMLEEDDGSSTQRLIAIGIAVVGPLGAAGAFTTLRAIGKRAHPLHALNSFSSQCAIASGIAMIVKKEPFILPGRPEWLAMFAMIGFFGFLAQIILTLGLQRETASRGSMGLYSQIIFAGIFERIFFTVEPSVLSAVGTVLILSSAIYVVMSKKPEEGAKKPRDLVVLMRVSEDEEIGQGLLDNQDAEPDSYAPNVSQGKPRPGRESVDSHDMDEDQDLTLPMHRG
ncbi:DUF6-domain-containing protein [Coprinopsis sp. MPI-PUGE-AT-0042]|nr:DUF6-domain-containing protein [Coprinopsis sp. MPI-PUGE-AT-0042]